MNNLDKIINLLNESYSPFHVVKNIENELKENGFSLLKENQNFRLEKGKKYYVKRNDTSIIAFEIPDDFSFASSSFLLTATHNDSPTFKIKPNPIIHKGNLMLLNTEPYGGGIYATWLDKPLSIAGRVLVEKDDRIESRLLAIDEDLLEIPNVCIHMNRTVNSENKVNPSTDTLPLFGIDQNDFSFDKYLLKQLNLEGYEVLSHDLFLYNREKAKLIGREKEFLASGRLDDLSAAYSALLGLLSSKKGKAIKVYASFDNEEVGSLTRQGANSTFLKETLKRVIIALGGKDDDFEKTIASSFMLSIDNAHADHPNHMEYTDKTTKVEMNKGIVIKYNANQSYTSDALSSAIVKSIMKKNAIPYQEYTNRSDLRGGSTLGNISNSEVSLITVDIGLAQLAMHSSYEIMGKKDIDYLVDFTKDYFASNIQIDYDTVNH